jgi:hypothetical protein
MFGFSEVVRILDAEEADSIRKLQSLLASRNLSHDLYYIDNYFGFLIRYIEIFQSNSLSLIDAIRYYRDIDTTLLGIQDNIWVQIYDKFLNVIRSNCDFQKIIHISDSIKQNISQTFINSENSIFQYAPITTSEVERKFSKYKMIFFR